MNNDSLDGTVSNASENVRIYGKDPGSCDPEKVKDMSELDLYLHIDALGGHIWWCQHQATHGRIDEVDLTEEKYALEYLAYQTTKFGVKLDEPAVGKHVNASPSYWAWFKFYDNHFKHVLTDEEWKKFIELHNNGEDVSAFLPVGNWKDTLEEAKQKKKTSE